MRLVHITHADMHSSCLNVATMLCEHTRLNWNAVVSVSLNGCNMLHNYAIAYLSYLDGYRVGVFSLYHAMNDKLAPCLPTECYTLLTSWSAVPWGA